jgi:hypothetical protein
MSGPNLHQLGLQKMIMKYKSGLIFWVSILMGYHLANAEDVRLNQVQVIGTHNSYHIAPHPDLMQLIQLTGKRLAESLDYSHRPLVEQLETLGVRQIELDLFHDPKGGHYSNPQARKTLKTLGKDPGPDPNASGQMDKPGLKVLHVQDIDYNSSALTFKDALVRVRNWSKKHPKHIPVMILVELKDGAIPGLSTKPVAFDKSALDMVDQEIDSIFARDEIFIPDDLRGSFATLPSAISGNGWPELDKVRGKVMFALDNEGKIRDFYLEGHENLSQRRLFVTAPSEGHPAAAFFKINQPTVDFEKIQRLVKSGYLVRTRADSDTRHARMNETFQRDKALASGAQYVSTDYREPRKEFSGYEVKFSGGVVGRPNPVSGAMIKSLDLE